MSASCSFFCLNKIDRYFLIWQLLMRPFDDILPKYRNSRSGLVDKPFALLSSFDIVRSRCTSGNDSNENISFTLRGGVHWIQGQFLPPYQNMGSVPPEPQDLFESVCHYLDKIPLHLKWTASGVLSIRRECVGNNRIQTILFDKWSYLQFSLHTCISYIP